MSEPDPHPAAGRLAAYQAGHLSAADVLAVSDHLAGCAPCRAALAALRGQTPPPARAPDFPPVLPDAPPDYEEMAALLDGTLDAAQSADTRTRLAGSPHAAAEFADLQRFRDECAARPAAIHSAGRGNAPAPGKVVAFPRPHRASFGFLAAAAVVLLAAGWWLFIAPTSRQAASLWAEADLSGLPEDLRRGVEQAARTGTVEAPPVPAELRPPSETLAGTAPAPAALRQIAPVGIIVREQQPTLRWTPCEGAAGYVVYLVDTAGNAPMVRAELPGAQTGWSPAAPLGRGTVYEWQVEARRGGEIIGRAPRPPAPESRFQVLDEPRAAELARLEGQYRQNPLVLGIVYTRMGLDEAAAAQFAELARKYPRSAEARRLSQESRGRVQGGMTNDE